MDPHFNITTLLFTYHDQKTAFPAELNRYLQAALVPVDEQILFFDKEMSL